MTFRELKPSEATSTSDKNIGTVQANNSTKVANVFNGKSGPDLTLPVSLTSSSVKLSKSKVVTKQSVEGCKIVSILSLTHSTEPESFNIYYRKLKSYVMLQLIRVHSLNH
jgi:hypothetical protein